MTSPSDTTTLLPRRYQIIAGFIAPTLIHGTLLFLRTLPANIILAASAAHLGVTVVALCIRPRMGFGMVLALVAWLPAWLMSGITNWCGTTLSA